MFIVMLIDVLYLFFDDKVYVFFSLIFVKISIYVLFKLKLIVYVRDIYFFVIWVVYGNSMVICSLKSF